jgi:aspartate/methionine/tyrosine aminotransferase
MNEAGHEVINLGIGSPDLPPPAAALDHLRHTVGDLSKQSYQPYRGIPELRAALATWYAHHYSVTLDVDSEILPLMGSKEGLMHLCMAYVDEGDSVLVPNPGYPAYSAITRLAGGIPVSYYLGPDNDYFPDIETLDTTAKIIFINYPHMPTGAVATLDQLSDLVNWARNHDVLIIHDNPYSHILNPTPISLLQVEGAMEVGVELTSLSKNYHMAGWRIGALVGGRGVIDAAITFKSNMDSGMYRPIQEAAAVALHHADFHTVHSATYMDRREIAYQIMDALACTYVRDRPGLFVWGRVPTGSGGSRLSDQVLEGAKVFITPGIIFGSAGTDYIRISLCASVSQLTEALSRINKQQA